MKERPILFTGEMVRAILDGRKTQTRRVIKPQPTEVIRNAYRTIGLSVPRVGTSSEGDIKCPYGQNNDRLWVRETFSIESNRDVGLEDTYKPPHNDGRPVRRFDCEHWGRYWQQCHYKASDAPPDLCCESEKCRVCQNDDSGPHWRPSIHMPRWASRIDLEVTDVRVERVQDMPDGDFEKEGFPNAPYAVGGNPFVKLWNTINEKRGFGWDTNPWVWVIEFKQIEKGTP